MTRLLAAVFAACCLAAPSGSPAQPVRAPAAPAALEDAAYIQWLVDHSMLHQAQLLARGFSGNAVQWRHPYGLPQPRAAVERASVWFTAYPASTIAARPGASVLTTLADERLWQAFQAIGIQGIHTGPMKLSGGVRNRSFTATVDGNFDRISFDIDPDFGTLSQYQAMVATARAHGAIVIGDVVPGHTGKGADFRLAERAYGDYPGIYHMVQIGPADWGVLPPVVPGHDAANLSPAAVDALQAKGYVVGRLSSRIFYQPGVKETDWSATDVVRGADGVRRRWVYLHYFKQGQPTLNWLDPSFAAERLVMGDAVHELTVLGDGMVRLDANGLLGIEREATGGVWSSDHPLSLTVNELIADMVRKLGGYTFEERAPPLEQMKALAGGGPDLTYDFLTRPEYDNALVSGDARLLRLVYLRMHQFGVDPGRFIHALQNHDELTMGMPYFTGTYADQKFAFRGSQIPGRELRERVQQEMYAQLTGQSAPYNLRFGDGVACTTATLIAATLGIRDLGALTTANIEQIKRLHLLLAFFNAMQPGVFALSGWDLVGALTLPAEAVRARLADGDTRWINRGAYDLIGNNPQARTSAAGLPRAVALYGSLPGQLTAADSFAAQLARLLRVRAELHLYAARLVDVPVVQATGVLVLAHQLPDGRGLEITAINFSARPVDESVAVAGVQPHAAVSDALDPRAAPLRSGVDGRVPLRLGPYEAKALRIG